MKKKSLVIFLRLVAIFILLFAFFPWSVEYTKFRSECEDYCKKDENSSLILIVKKGTRPFLTNQIVLAV